MFSWGSRPRAGEFDDVATAKIDWSWAGRVLLDRDKGGAEGRVVEGVVAVKDNLLKRLR